MAVIARAIAHVLIDAGIEVAIVPIPGELSGRRAETSFRSHYIDANATLPYPLTLFLDSPPVVLNLLENAPALFAAPVNAIVPFWELTRFPAAWERAFSAMDLVLAPSTFIADAVARSFSIPVAHIPVLPTAVPVDGVPQRPGLPPGFRVLSSFDVLSSVSRKNPSASIDAFLQAFTDRDDVHLLLKTWQTRESQLSGLEPLLDRHRNVHVISDDLSSAEMAALHRDSHAYIALHRAEGLGLGMLDSMAFGRPVVATDYSGNRDFLNDENGCPIGYDLVPVVAPEGIYSPAYVGEAVQWADPRIADAGRALARLHDDRDFYESRASRSRATIDERRAKFASLEWLEPLRALLRDKQSRPLVPREETLSAPPEAQPSVEIIFRRIAHAFEGDSQGRRPLFSAFIPTLTGFSPVLDVGCGDGLFLKILAENGIQGVGIDLDPVKVAECRAQGLTADLSDLRELENRGATFGGIWASHIIEHIEPRAAIEFLMTAYRILRPGGRLVIVTPNVGFAPVIENFWLDLTHVRPYPRVLLAAMCEAIGFSVIGQASDLGGMKDTYVIGTRS